MYYVTFFIQIILIILELLFYIYDVINIMCKLMILLYLNVVTWVTNKITLFVS